jgi:hypothetical protein
MEENEPNEPANFVCCRIAGCLRLTMKREPLLISMDEASVRKGTDSMIFQIFQPSKFDLQEDTLCICLHQTISGWWFQTCFIFPIILGMSSSQVINSIIFQMARAKKPPTR